MPYYLGEIRLNNSKTSEKNTKKRKRLFSRLLALVLISLLILAPITFISAAIAAEPSIESVLDGLGFNNIALTDTETFSPRIYNITLLAEYASFNAVNDLSYYALGTSDFQTIFTGPEGATGDCRRPA